MTCDDGNCEHGWHYDDPRTLRGGLQRGRGVSGLRIRLEPDPDLIFECLGRDYRWDWLVDERSVYLAKLVRDLQLPLDALIEQMFACGPWKFGGEPDPADRDNQFTVALEVLSLLGRAGDERALDTLRRYVSSGVRWIEVLEHVTRDGCEAWDDLWEVAERRLEPSDAEHILCRGQPWVSWQGRDPGLDAVISAALTGVKPRPPRPSVSATTDELISTLGSLTANRDAKINALRTLRDREPDPALLGVLDRPGVAELPLIYPVVRRLGVAALAAARTWLKEPEHPLNWTAQQIVAEHGDARDVPALEAELAHLGAGDGWCRYDTITAGLARILSTGTPDLPARDRLVQDLRYLWMASPHSYERASYLTSLLALDPDRTVLRMPALLFDCERDVRLLAIAHTPLDEDIRAWLADLAHDPMEEPEVRAAAAARLDTAPDSQPDATASLPT